MMQAIPPEAGTKLIEISVGLGAAAIIIDKILTWTLKWKRNGNGKVTKLPCVETKTWALHDSKTDALMRATEEMVKVQQNQIRESERIAESNERQERLLMGIKENLHG